MPRPETDRIQRPSYWARAALDWIVRAVRLAAAIMLCAFAAPASACAQSTALSAPGDIVLRQLAAFRANDWEAAYALASESIRALFDRAAFEDMVRSGYPEIARSTDAAITDGEEAPDGSVYLTVVVRGANGSAVEALYEMVREHAGWRVNGVVTRPIASSV